MEPAAAALAVALEGHVLEPAGYLRPFGPPPWTHVIGVAVECLVQDCEEQEWPLGAGGGFGQPWRMKTSPCSGLLAPYSRNFPNSSMISRMPAASLPNRPKYSFASSKRRTTAAPQGVS